MVWTTAFALALLAEGVTFKSDLDDPALVEWLKTHSPDGVDVYPDGTVWISAGRNGTGAQFGLLARDVKAMKGAKDGYVWLLSNYQNDKTVKHRRMLERLYVNCKLNNYAITTWLTYGADLRVIDRGKANLYDTFDPVPGTLSEKWLRIACQE